MTIFLAALGADYTTSLRHGRDYKTDSNHDNDRDSDSDSDYDRFLPLSKCGD